MKKFLILIFSFFCLQCSAFAIQDTAPMPYIAIITDHILDPPTTYYNYPASSELFANAVVNELRLRNNVRILGTSDVREIMKLSTLSPQLKQFVNQYNINYNIDFTKLRQFAQALGVDNILLVTSNIDYQSYVMKGTIWNVLNIPGADVVNPVYQIVTNVALIDVKEETIVWQNSFRKNLKARDNTIIPTSFAPNNQQLKAVGDYSKVLSYQISNAVEEHTCQRLYFDKFGNRYNKKSNSVIGKTKYYTREGYEKYIGIDVPGAPITNRSENFKKRQAQKSKIKAQQKALKQQNEQKNAFNAAPTKNPNNINNTQGDETDVMINNNTEYTPIENPIRDYMKNDTIQLTPEWTPNASGNKIEDL